MKTRTLDLAGPLHLADFGGEGSPIVLVHGLGGSHVNWLPVGAALSRHGRVLAPDLIGFGRTPLAGRSPAVDANVELLARFLEREVREPAVLVGNSMGGLVSLATAARHPELVSRLVLVAPALLRPPSARTDRVVATLFTIYMIPGAGELFLHTRMRKVGPEKMVRDMLRLCGLDPKTVDPAVMEAHLSLAHERRWLPWADQAFLGAARSVLFTLARPDRVRAMIDAVRAPGLLVQGTADRLVPLAVSEAVARRRPDWRFEVLEGIGHTPMIQDPAGFVELVGGWLATPSSEERRRRAG